MHLLIYYEDVDELRERLISVWCELDQSVVNHAIDEWRRLSACRRWRRTFWTLLMIAILKITMSKWQHCKFEFWKVHEWYTWLCYYSQFFSHICPRNSYHTCVCLLIVSRYYWVIPDRTRNCVHGTSYSFSKLHSWIQSHSAIAACRCNSFAAFCQCQGEGGRGAKFRKSHWLLTRRIRVMRIIVHRQIRFVCSPNASVARDTSLRYERFYGDTVAIRRVGRISWRNSNFFVGLMATPTMDMCDYSDVQKQAVCAADICVWM